MRICVLGGKFGLPCQENRLRVSEEDTGAQQRGNTGGWRKLGKDQLHGSYSTKDSVRVVKHKWMR